MTENWQSATTHRRAKVWPLSFDLRQSRPAPSAGAGSEGNSGTRANTGSLLWLFWVYLLLIAYAELFTAVANALYGMILHALLLVALLGHGTLGRHESERRLALALTLAPMIRMFSLAMPLTKFPQIAWYPLTAVPLLAATWLVVRQLGIPRRELGLSMGRVPLQLMIMLSGLGLGWLEYMILRPAQIALSYDWWGFALPALVLLVFTGFNEEIIFRGLLQAVALPVSGRWGLVYVSLLFGALHIGYLSVVDLVFVTFVGLAFACVVAWGRSLLGVTLAHGLTNTMLFVVMPYLAQQAPPQVMTFALWASVAGTAMSLVGAFLLWRHRARN